MCNVAINRVETPSDMHCGLYTTPQSARVTVINWWRYNLWGGGGVEYEILEYVIKKEVEEEIEQDI